MNYQNLFGIMTVPKHYMQSEIQTRPVQPPGRTNGFTSFQVGSRAQSGMTFTLAGDRVLQIMLRMMKNGGTDSSRQRPGKHVNKHHVLSHRIPGAADEMQDYHIYKIVFKSIFRFSVPPNTDFYTFKIILQL